MTLSFVQWVRLGFGAVALMKKHADAVPLLRPLVNDALDLWQTVVPPDVKSADDAISHNEVIDKIRTGDLSDEERALMDRVSRTWGGQ